MRRRTAKVEEEPNGSVSRVRKWVDGTGRLNPFSFSFSFF